MYRIRLRNLLLLSLEVLALTTTAKTALAALRSKVGERDTVFVAAGKVVTLSDQFHPRVTQHPVIIIVLKAQQ